MPTSLYIKLNVAVDWWKNGYIWGVGLLVRDARGRVIIAHCEKISLFGDVIQLCTREG